MRDEFICFRNYKNRVASYGFASGVTFCANLTFYALQFREWSFARTVPDIDSDKCEMRWKYSEIQFPDCWPQEACISASASNLFTTTPRTPVIYFLPKIHKPDNPGRPIVSACSCPTELISSFLDGVMFPLVKTLPSYIKDTKHALQIFDQIRFSGSHKFIFTMDVKSLYTVIPHRDGLEALKFFLNKRTILEPSTTTLILLAKLVLTLNNFSFDGEHYQQISGVAMGTKMGPSYANLFVGYVEQQIFEQYTGPIPDFFWQIHWWLLGNSIMYTCGFREIH